MLMFNKLPYFVMLKEKKYKINVDFRNMISFENKLQDKSVGNSEKIEYSLRHFYPAFFDYENYNKLLLSKDLYKEACDKLVWFYKCGRDDYHKTKGNSSKQSSQIYSYDYDDEYIFGAFEQCYPQYDLTRDELHWWKFKALLKSLTDDTEFVKIKGYRAYNGKDKEMLALKNYWELPLPKTEQDRLDKLYETLK